MDNLHTLTVFVHGQPQAVILQYKTAEKALHDRDAMTRAPGDGVLLGDDYGRELSLRLTGNEIVLYQDVDLAAEGSVLAGVKNNIANTMSQIKSQQEIEKDPAVKSAITRAQLQQSLTGGVIRQ